MKMIELSERDMALAILMGSRRNGNKVAAGIPSHAYGGDDVAIHILGATGEVAVARLFGVEPDRTILSGGDGGTDLIYRGLTWDVKTRGTINSDLLIAADMSDFRADYCVLCWRFAPDRIGVVGYISRKLFRQRARRVEARGPRLCLSWRQMAMGKWQ